MRRRTAVLTICNAALGLGQDKALPVSMTPVTGEGAKYWPRWRGPSGQGLVEGSGYADTWSDQNNVVWKAPVPGSGNSSPVIWGDRIFLTTAYAPGTFRGARADRRSILCFSRRDGKLLWEVSAPETVAERVQPKNGWASGTVATDGERAYAFMGNHGLIAVDFDGKIVWRRDLGETNNYHGSACSPLIYRDTIVVYQDQAHPAQAYVAAFDKRTGKTVWMTKREETVGWGSPVAIRAGDREEIIVHSQYKVYSYNPNSGAELWQCSGNTMEVTPTPVAGHGLVYCCSGRAGPTLAIRPGGAGDVTGTHVAWQSPRGSSFIPSPLLYGDYLYLVNDMTSVATCFEAKTGKSMWQGRLGVAQREGFSASPVGVDGKVFITNDSGETFVLKAGPEFNLLHVNQFNERTLASPAVVDGRWYFRTEKHLLAIGKKA